MEQLLWKNSFNFSALNNSKLFLHKKNGPKTLLVRIFQEHSLTLTIGQAPPSFSVFSEGASFTFNFGVPTPPTSAPTPPTTSTPFFMDTNNQQPNSGFTMNQNNFTQQTANTTTPNNTFFQPPTSDSKKRTLDFPTSTMDISYDTFHKKTKVKNGDN
jgi:hypothetical protein